MIQCYASGDGALHFTDLERAMPNQKRDGKFHYQRSGDLIATGKPITKADVEAYVAGRPEDDRVKSWWILQMDGVHWVLVHPVLRINDDTLLMDGCQYQYTIDPNITVEKRFDKVTISDEEGPYEVRNISTLGALIYFVRNEDRIIKLVNEAGLPWPQLPVSVPASAYTD